MYNEKEIKKLLENYKDIKQSRFINDLYLYSIDLDNAMERLDDELYNVAIAITQGYTNNEIAGIYKCSERTIKRRKKKLIGKLQNLLNGT